MDKAVLVTGASTGIGHHLAHYLAERGHVVYAAASNDSDIAALGGSKNVVPIKLDVTDLAQIETAVAFITAQGTGLYGLVNNAGLGGLGGFTTWSEAEFLGHGLGQPGFAAARFAFKQQRPFQSNGNIHRFLQLIAGKVRLR